MCGASTAKQPLRSTWRQIDRNPTRFLSNPTNPSPLRCVDLGTSCLIVTQDMFAFNRDYFTGTQFDLSKGPAAGPWGNPNRYLAVLYFSDRFLADMTPMASLMLAVCSVLVAWCIHAIVCS